MNPKFPKAPRVEPDDERVPRLLAELSIMLAK
jgi:hypothetical protein